MQLDAITAALIGGAIGSGVAGLFTIIGQFLTRRSEERRHLLDVCFKTAVENWKRDSEIALEASKGRRGTLALSPLDLYIIHTLALSKIIANKRLSQEEILDKWSCIAAATREAFKKAEQKDQNI